MNDMHSLAGEYAVGSLTSPEVEQYEAHLATCTSCREEVADMRDIAAQLSTAVATDPPPALRAAVLARIAQTPQDSAQTPQHLAPPSPLSGASGSNVSPLRRRRPANWATGLLAAAAVVAAVAMGSWALSSRDDARDATAQAQQLTTLLAAGDVRTASAEFTTGGEGTVVVSPSHHEALLLTVDLPDLPSGKVYQAWTAQGSMVPAGLVPADSSPSIVRLPEDALSATQVAVTVEPAGGSKAPTSDPVFAVDLATG